MRLIQFTDIHFGARGNSEEHNLDCLDFLQWFCQKAKQEKATHVAFLGDWFENRHAISVKTLHYSQEGAKMLNALGLPVYFLIGNHDLHQRNNRDIFSTSHFNEFSNFVLIDKPTELTRDLFAVPFLFKHEYAEMASEINKYKYVLGHFEFKDFIISGSSNKMEHGPEIELYHKPLFIFSGHYHKRQRKGNTVYIGNCVPSNFGDAGDSDRGCALLDSQTNSLQFYDWEDAPLYEYTTLSKVISGDVIYKPKTRVLCRLDMQLPYTEVQHIRQEMIDIFSLRDFTVEEEAIAKQDILEQTLDVEFSGNLHTEIKTMIRQGVLGANTVDNEFLVELYEELE
jgi:DNA repair exonuclease SbcCD nuclease subunit